MSKVTLELNKVKFNAKDLAVSEPSAGYMASNLYEKVLEGKASAIDTYEALTFMSKVADALKSCADDNGKNKFTDLLRQEIQENLNGEKAVITKFGSKFSLAETGTKYDYSACADPMWNYYNKEIERLDKLKKKRETYLKTIEAPSLIGNVTITETGELFEEVTVNPPIKTSTPSFKVELLKG